MRPLGHILTVCTLARCTLGQDEDTRLGSQPAERWVCASQQEGTAARLLVSRPRAFFVPVHLANAHRTASATGCCRRGGIGCRRGGVGGYVVAQRLQRCGVVVREPDLTGRSAASCSQACHDHATRSEAWRSLRAKAATCHSNRPVKHERFDMRDGLDAADSVQRLPAAHWRIACILLARRDERYIGMRAVPARPQPLPSSSTRQPARTAGLAATQRAAMIADAHTVWPAGSIKMNGGQGACSRAAKGTAGSGGLLTHSVWGRQTYAVMCVCLPWDEHDRL